MHVQKNMFRDGDVIAGALTAALGAYITVTAARWEVMGPDGPGPGFFPIGYGIALIALSLILVFQRFTAAKEPRDDKPVDWPGFRRAGLTWAAFAASAGLMPVIGFYVSLGLLALFLGLFVFNKPLKTALITGVLSALGFYVTFGLALDVSLPVGLLGF
jgi:putative tricarboxylic transport membrane protein